MNGTQNTQKYALDIYLTVKIIHLDNLPLQRIRLKLPDNNIKNQTVGDILSDQGPMLKSPDFKCNLINLQLCREMHPFLKNHI